MFLWLIVLEIQSYLSDFLGWAAGGTYEDRPELAVGEREGQIAEGDAGAHHVQIRVALEDSLLGALQCHSLVHLLLAQAAHGFWVSRVHSYLINIGQAELLVINTRINIIRGQIKRWVEHITCIDRFK